MTFLRDLPLIFKELFSYLQSSYLIDIPRYPKISFIFIFPVLPNCPAVGIGLTLCARLGDSDDCTIVLNCFPFSSICLDLSRFFSIFLKLFYIFSDFLKIFSRFFSKSITDYA